MNASFDGNISDQRTKNTNCTTLFKSSSDKGLVLNIPSETIPISESGSHRMTLYDKKRYQNGVEIIAKEVAQPKEKISHDIVAQRVQSSAVQISQSEELANVRESIVSDSECNPVILSVRGNATDVDLSIPSDRSQDLCKESVQFLKETDSIVCEKERMSQKSASDSQVNISKPSCGRISEKDPIVCHPIIVSSSCDMAQAGNLVLADRMESNPKVNPELSMPASSILLTMVSKANVDKPIDSLTASSISDSMRKAASSTGSNKCAQRISESYPCSVEKTLTTPKTSKSFSTSVVKVGQRSAVTKFVKISPSCISNNSLSLKRSSGSETIKNNVKRRAVVSSEGSKSAVKIVLAGSQNVQLSKTVTVTSTSGIVNTLNRVNVPESTKDKSSSSNIPKNSANSFVYQKTVAEKSLHLASIQEGLSLKEALKTSLLKPSKKPRENLEKLFVCSVCGDEFYQQEFLKHHMDRKVFVIDYYCKGCKGNLTFYNKCKFWLHVKNEGTEKLDNLKSSFNLKPYCDSDEEKDSTLIKCKFCLEDYTPDDFKKHLSKIKSSMPPIYCHKCLISLANRCALLAHQTIHEAGSKDVMCPECGETFSPSDGLKVLFDHLDSCYHFNYSCIFHCQCGELFKTSLALQYHMLKSHAKLLWRCNKCQRCYSSSHHLFHHCTSVHNSCFTPSRIVYCALCNEGFENALKLKSHFEDHAEEQSLTRKKVLQCFLCKVSSSTPNSLNSHIEKSHSHRPKRCTICFGLFESRQNLVQHIVSKKCLPGTLPRKFHDCIDAPPRQEEAMNMNLSTYQKMFDSPISKSGHKILTNVSVRQLLAKSKALEKPVSLKNSVDQPKDKRKFQCHTCRICLIGSQNYEKHISLHKSYGLVRNQTHCGICKKTVDDSLIQSHMENHQKRGIIVCSLCHSRNFDTMHDALQHSVNLCNYKEVENDGAAFVYSNQYPKATSDKTNEIIEEEGENIQEKTGPEESSVFPCLMCGLTFSSKQTKDDHVSRIHDGTRTLYFCLLCKKKGVRKHFTKKNLISKHISHKHRVVDPTEISNFIHVEEQNISSGHVVPTETNNESHGAPPPKQLRLATEGDYVCGKCGFSMGDSRLFGEHIATHNPRKEPQCPECGLCFTVLAALKKHLFMVHKIKGMDEYLEKKGMLDMDQEEDEEEEYDDHLDVCNSEVSFEPTNLSNKETGGLGEKRSRFCDGSSFECNVCYREFSSETALKSHMRNHGMAFIRSRRFDKPSS